MGVCERGIYLNVITAAVYFQQLTGLRNGKKKKKHYRRLPGRKSKNKQTKVKEEIGGERERERRKKHSNHFILFLENDGPLSIHRTGRDLTPPIALIPIVALAVVVRRRDVRVLALAHRHAEVRVGPSRRCSRFVELPSALPLRDLNGHGLQADRGRSGVVVVGRGGGERSDRLLSQRHPRVRRRYILLQRRQWRRRRKLHRHGIYLRRRHGRDSE